MNGNNTHGESRPLVAVTMGDPAGVGPEVIAKALARPDIHELCRPLVLGDRAAMERAVSVTGCGLEIRSFSEDSPHSALSDKYISLLPLSALSPTDMAYGRPSQAAGNAVHRYITEAVHLCQSGKAAAMATAPISKEALNRAGYKYPGHTELLAELTSVKDFVMMLAGDRLRVALVTIHEALADVPGLLTREKILSTIRIVHRDVGLYFRKSPRLAVLALNPHCGEGGLFGCEERDLILPAVEAARAEGIDASGPHSADTLFHFAARGEYDAVICMYHDQGLIPLKLLHFDDGVNITLGLPIIRTSADHGTAYGLAGSGKASELSMAAAVRTAACMALVKGRNM